MSFLLKMLSFFKKLFFVSDECVVYYLNSKKNFDVVDPEIKVFKRI